MGHDGRQTNACFSRARRARDHCCWHSTRGASATARAWAPTRRRPDILRSGEVDPASPNSSIERVIEVDERLRAEWRGRSCSASTWRRCAASLEACDCRRDRRGRPSCLDARLEDARSTRRALGGRNGARDGAFGLGLGQPRGFPPLGQAGGTAATTTVVDALTSHSILAPLTSPRGWADALGATPRGEPGADACRFMMFLGRHDGGPGNSRARTRSCPAPRRCAWAWSRPCGGGDAGFREGHRLPTWAATSTDVAHFACGYERAFDTEVGGRCASPARAINGASTPSPPVAAPRYLHGRFRAVTAVGP